METVPQNLPPRKLTWAEHMQYHAGAQVVQASRPVPTYPSRAFNATYDDLCGIALRCADGSVHFRRDDTQGWQQLTDDDGPALLLAGRLDLIEEQRLLDNVHGNIYQQVIWRNTERAREAA